jgi:multimeric flavodoxin WrbA
MPQLTAVLLDCTLKPSPAVSDTEALMRKVVEWYDRFRVTSEIVRVIDYAVKFGISSDEGGGDEWPLILAKVKAADIFVMGIPIRYGVRSSVAQMVIERLDGTYAERNEVGPHPLYNKVGGVVVTGNEDGAHSCAATTLFDLSHLGCTIPPNADVFTESAAGRMAHNTVHFARLLKADPIPAERNTFDKEANHAEEPNPLSRKLFGGLPATAGDMDPGAVEAERRAAEEGRLLERRRLLDLTWREKGLPEKRKPRPPIDPLAEGDAKP